MDTFSVGRTELKEKEEVRRRNGIAGFRENT